jgi:phosphate transport system substrate-binding protein
MAINRWPTGFLLLLTVLIGVTGCSKSGSSGGSGASSTVRLQGAGASFPALLYQQWFRQYGEQSPGIRVDYQSVGSGQGVRSVIDHTVDFGASDAAMTAEEMQQVPEGVTLLPVTAGAIVLGYNLEGVSELKLSREVYAGIFLGDITKWDDPRILADNPGKSGLKGPVNVIVRADSSGTTYVFSQHLSTISPTFKEKVGVNKQPDWPVGTKSKGNEGVTAALKSTPGSIGYIEFGYAENNRVTMAALENQSGQYVMPSAQSAGAALAAVEMPADLLAWLPDPEGESSYPIVTYTWIICYKKYADPKKSEALKGLLRWCLKEGQAASVRLGYVPLPEAVAGKVLEAVEQIQ